MPNQLFSLLFTVDVSYNMSCENWVQYTIGDRQEDPKIEARLRNLMRLCQNK